MQQAGDMVLKLGQLWVMLGVLSALGLRRADVYLTREQQDAPVG